jgi:hypothetical protein
MMTPAPWLVLFVPFTTYVQIVGGKRSIKWTCRQTWIMLSSFSSFLNRLKMKRAIGN